MNVIIAENISKSYPVYATPRQRLRDAFYRIPELERFTALSNVSFSLGRGETLGVLGVNGAGKSTLLKIIAGVVTPTSGAISVNGRVSALLELGAGFSPDYTGIENARMALALAGIPGGDIDAALENVLAFADIGDFARMPVKTYSSGMFVRLAFACATETQPDILLVDEALSVGDLFFQARCMNRIKALLKKGTSLVFVSHDIGAVKAVCSRCLLLDGGSMFMLGPSDQVARAYFSRKVEAMQPAACEAGDQLAPESFKKRAAGRLGDGRVRFISVTLVGGDGKPLQSAYFNQPATLRMVLVCRADVEKVCVGYHIQDASGSDVIYSDTAVEDVALENWREGQIHYINWRFSLALGEGAHNIAAVCSLPKDMYTGDVEFMDYIHTAAQFTMQRRDSAKIYSLAYWKNEVEAY